MTKKALYFILFLLIGFLIVGSIYFQRIFGVAVAQKTEILIPSDTSIEELTEILGEAIDKKDFTFVANLKKFTKPKPGKYILEEGLSMNDLVNKLRIGDQSPIKITFNNQDTLAKLAGRIGQQIEADSLSLLNVFKDQDFLTKNGFSEASALGMYIPNQYETYWNTSPEKFRAKMLSEYKKFWNKSRTKKAQSLGLNKNQVITLASIVQKETAQISERPTVAGLYLNRYNDGWPLQADPTVIYAIKELKGHHIVIKRVLNKDLTIDSPYNTYLHTGLPPSLIAMPDISAIDAVLNAEKHNYYYMCASVNKIGFHEFAHTLAQHNRNARKYQNWINQRGIIR